MTLHNTKTASCLVISLLPFLLSTLAIPAPTTFTNQVNQGSFQSTNWSGYAVTGAAGSVTDAKGSWKVPAIVGTCPKKNQYSSFWVGIDGFNSNTVEQTGTDSDCQSHHPTYYAWYEFYPNPSFIIGSISVHPGDIMSAEVSYSGGVFTATITDSATGQTFSTSATVSTAQRSSAEWIAEAPSSRSGILPLANFGTVLFGSDNTGVSSTCTATVNGVSGAIGSFGSNVQEITMVNTRTGATKALPSALSSDGTSFSVQWVSAGP